MEDPTKLKAVHFKYPELTSKDAEKEIKDSYNELLSLEDKLYEARKTVRNLADKLALKKQEFKEKTSTCTLEFENTKKDIVD